MLDDRRSPATQPLTLRKEPATKIANDTQWLLAPTSPALSGGAVHVWRASLDVPEEHFHRLARALSGDEHERAGRFRFEEDRRRFVVGRGILRELVGRYLGVEPRNIRFRYGPYGKPELAPAEVLRFSVSHSHQLALYAFAKECDVGVDVEYLRSVRDIDSIIERHFTSREKALLRTLSGGRKLETFFIGWTSKEACLKAIGNGLTQPLESIDVAVHSGEPIRRVTLPGPYGVEEWSLNSVNPAAGYIGALAVARRGDEVSYWTRR